MPCLSRTFSVSSCPASKLKAIAQTGDFSFDGDIPVECNMDHTVQESTSEPDDDCKADLEVVGILFDELLSCKTTFSQVHDSEAFFRVNGQLEAKKRSLKN
ncbi:hypothetical protein HOLleu_43743 [Holothuria leucospilota]|uniref:Uncharacterized protein n=1 Tax=Holothuria leucospilota TaxID=206669 RepID=A0A9Q0YDE8_HOLLE|nr:hypothetical protein HOLleu_43743 [Holothuria leucospilota]